MNQPVSSRFGAPRSGELRFADIPGIDPSTGLASDYLNHFYEPLLLLENLDDDPDLLADLAAWRPRSYTSHFGESPRADRRQVIDAYHDALPQLKLEFDAIADAAGKTLATELPTLLLEARNGANVSPIASRLAEMLRRYIRKLDGLIHGREMA